LHKKKYKEIYQGLHKECIRGPSE